MLADGLLSDPVVFFRVFGIGRDPAATIPIDADRRSRDHHHTLSLCPWNLSGALSGQLDLPVRRLGRLYRADV